MKKIVLGLFVLVVIVCLFIFKNNNCSNNQAKVYSINNKNYCLLTANNQEQWERGLMFYKKPIDFDGMVFIFPDKQVQRFWNENTYLNLNLYWMDDEKVIGKSLLPSVLKSKQPVTVTSPGKVNRVVEIIF